MPANDLDKKYMRLALEEAEKAFKKDELPIGAIMVKDDEVIARAHNLCENWNDPTAHAEILAIRSACKALNNWRLSETTLYVTLEPCPMCLWAILKGRVKRVVFGACDKKAGAFESQFNLPFESIFNYKLLYRGGVMENECQQLIDNFFKRIRP